MSIVLIIIIGNLEIQANSTVYWAVDLTGESHAVVAVSGSAHLAGALDIYTYAVAANFEYAL